MLLTNADPIEIETTFHGILKSSACAAPIGHLWPEDRGPCKRCGQPSALPDTPTCRHGTPNHGNFGGHDCAYADARDALIPFAEATANDFEGRRVKPNDEEWNLVFHRNMDILAHMLKVAP